MYGEQELSSDTSTSRFARCLYLSPIAHRRALPAVPCRAALDFAIMAPIDWQIQALSANFMPIGPVSTAPSRVMLLLCNSLV
jgi:hypothetical protein